MGLFGSTTRAAVLLDIGSASVGGGLIYYKEGETPVMCFSTRSEVVVSGDISVTDAMLQCLEDVCALLVREGLPTLRRSCTNAHIDLVLASVAGPWQETHVRTVSIQDTHPFTFTRALMEKAVKEDAPKTGRIVTDTSVISTVLNGYHTDMPYGKHATHAELTVLTSTIDRFAAKEVTRIVRSAFHTHRFELTTFAPVSYAVISDLYPAQKDFMVLDVTGTTTDAMLVKQGTIVGVKSIGRGIHDLLEAGRAAAREAPHTRLVIDSVRNQSFAPKAEAAEAEWLGALREVCSELAKDHPLPRALFLLADDHARPFLKRLIEESTLKSLWLTADQLTVAAIAPEHVRRLVQARGLADADIFLAILGTFYKDKLAKGKA